MHPWTLLVLAGLLEVGWAIGLKYTDGFTRLTPSLLTGAAMALSMYLLALAARELPIGTTASATPSAVSTMPMMRPSRRNPNSSAAMSGMIM